MKLIISVTLLSYIAKTPSQGTCILIFAESSQNHHDAGCLLDLAKSLLHDTKKTDFWPHESGKVYSISHQQLPNKGLVSTQFLSYSSTTFISALKAPNFVYVYSNTSIGSMRLLFGDI